MFPRSFKEDHPRIRRGEGVYLYDESGRAFLDAASGAVSANIGYGVEEVAEAIARQTRDVPFAHGSVWDAEVNERAASLVAELAPAGFGSVWFVNSGSEAMEAAMKMARQFFLERDGVSSSKYLIIGRQNSYHGSTLGTLGIGGNVNRRRLFMPMLFDHPKIEAPYCYRCPYGATYPGCGIRCAEELDRTIRRIGARYIAAFVAEPVGGSTAGALVPPEEYWPRIREICTVHDVLLIADEVMTGCGRTGRNFAVDHWGVVPDLIGTAKGLAACYYPVGALIVSDRVAEAFRKGSGVFAHSHTFNGMPAASAAVVAVLEYMKKHRLVERAARWGEFIEKEWVPELVTQDLVGDVRGKGLLWGLELVKDRVSKEPFPAAAGVASRLKALALERGMTLYPGRSMVDGERGDNVIVAPPLVIAREEMARVREILLDSLKALAREL